MTKTEKLRICKEILATHNVNDVVSDKYNDFIIELFNNHWIPLETNRKVEKVYIDIYETFKTKSFSILLNDGELIKCVSYKKCIDGKGSNLFNISKACRVAVRPITDTYMIENTKDGFGICALDGKKYPIKGLNVDHYDMTFQQLVRLFVYYVTEEKILKGMHKNSCNSFNRETKDLFIKYHTKYTKLRLVNEKLNSIMG